jgi:hypothetical protein
MKKDSVIKKSAVLALVIAVFCVAWPVNGADEAKAPLTLIQTIPLPSVEGRFDHFTIDVKSENIFLPAEEDHGVLAIDLRRGAMTKKIGGFVKAHAILYRPTTMEFLVSDDDGTYKIFDEKTLTLKKTEHLTLNYADGIRYDPATEYLYIVNVRKNSEDPEDGSFLAIVDTKTWQHIGDIPFKGGHVEEVAIEPSGSRLFIAIASRREIGIIDRVKRAEIGAFPLPVPGLPYAVVMDEPDHRLFVALRKPEQLIVLNSDDGQLVAKLPTAAGADDIFYDAAHKRIYVSAGVTNEPEGYVSAYQQLDADHYQVLAKIATGSASATSLLVPELNRYYVAAQRKEKKDAELQVYRINP